MNPVRRNQIVPEQSLPRCVQLIDTERKVQEVVTDRISIKKIFGLMRDSLIDCGCKSNDSVSMDLTHASHLVQGGIAFYRAGEKERAKECYEQALVLQERLAPDSLDTARTHHILGLFHRGQGNIDEALRHFQRGLSLRETLDPNSLDVAMSCYEIGTAYLSQRKEMHSLKYLHKMLDIKMSFSSENRVTAKGYAALGFLYLRQNRPSEALRVYEKSISIMQSLIAESSAEHMRYVKVAQKISEVGEEKQEITKKTERQLSCDRSNLCIFYESMAEAYRILGSQEEALQGYYKSLQARRITEIPLKSLEYYQSNLDQEELNSPNVSFYYDCLGLLYHKLEQGSEALECFKKSSEIRMRSEVFPGNPSSEFQGIAYPSWWSCTLESWLETMEDFDLEKALLHVRSMTENNPFYRGWHVKEGEILQKLGNVEEALCSVEQALRCNPECESAKALQRCLLAQRAEEDFMDPLPENFTQSKSKSTCTKGLFSRTKAPKHSVLPVAIFHRNNSALDATFCNIEGQYL